MNPITNTDTGKYIKILNKYPKTYNYLEEKSIKNFQKLDSLWRKENLLLKVDCKSGSYVFKKINSDEKYEEIERVRLMSKNYPDLTPEIFIVEGGSYLMEYIDGDSFFNLDSNKKVEKMSLAGKILSKEYKKIKSKKVDISNEVFNSFARYREKRKKYFSEDELRLDKGYFDIFKNVEDNISHNDLNAANLLYRENSVKLIDPSEEGFNDISRDIGRYCASCFFNNYDYFGNDKKQSLDIANAFLQNFDEDLLMRAKYYIGESFLSFLGFDTVSVEKSKLKNLCINVLTKNKPISLLLEDSI